MGANPWWYVVDYEADINAALQALRQREFQAGRYFPALDYTVFPITSDYPALGAQHASIEEAIEEADADGTQSILDIQEVSEFRSAGAVSPLTSLEILHIFGTETPHSDLINDEEIPDSIFDFIGRGEAIYVVLYRENQPDKLLFVGYSND